MNKKTLLNQIKRTTQLVVFVFLLCLATPLAASIPVPQGVSGTVYELDGVTPVPKGVSIEVTNLATGVVVSGTVGNAKPGFYAASIGGSLGNTIHIRCSNEWNEVNRTLSLQGVMRGIDLFLNMTPPALPPVWITDSLGPMYEDVLYTQILEAEDVNNDPLTFFLIEGPTGMSVLPNGTLSWTPTHQTTGNYTIQLQVQDDRHLVNVSLQLQAISQNDPVFITSSPSLRARVGELYTYTITATDEENQTITYALHSSLPGARFNNNTGHLQWRPTSAGSVEVVLLATDQQTWRNQTFTIQVQPAPLTETTSAAASAGGGGAGGGAPPNLGLLRDQLSGELSLEPSDAFSELSAGQLKKIRELLETQNALVYPFTEADIKVHTTRPQATSPVDRLTYNYLEIDAPQEESEIYFVVPRSWLTAHGVKANDVELMRYTNSWESLDTTVIDTSDHHPVFKARTPGFSYFAISAKEHSSRSAQDPSSTIIRLPYIIKGIIYQWGRFNQYPANTPVTIQNLNDSLSFTILTGLPEDEGAYIASIPGIEGDHIEISIGDFSQVIILGSSATISVDVVNQLFGEGFVQLTGAAIMSPQDTTISGFGLLTLLVIGLSAIFIRVHYAKKRK